MTHIEIELPSAVETERQLLGALLLMLPNDRDQAVRKVSVVWFSDLWHRRLFNVICRNRRRDFGAEMLDAMTDGDGPLDRSAWWLAMLFCDRDGKSTSGRPQNWQLYASTLERLHSYRCRILLKAEELQDLINASRTETYPLHEFAGRDAKADDGLQRA